MTVPVSAAIFGSGRSLADAHVRGAFLRPEVLRDDLAVGAGEDDP